MRKEALAITVTVALVAGVACSDPASPGAASGEPRGSTPEESAVSFVPGGLRAAREPDEPFEAARARQRAMHVDAGGGDAGDGHASALDSAVPIGDVDFSVVPDWKTESKVEAGFDAIRDPRWITTTKMLRRESWLYPDDGCFARAALAGQRLESEGYARPLKLFVFGNLVVRTANAPQDEKECPPWGQVSWWYHVVPVVRVGSVVKVLDPAVEPYRALEVHEWVKRINSAVVDGGPESGITLAVCDPYAYDPDSSCLTAKAASESSAASDEDYYLKAEWSRQVFLGREPKKVLGNLPPWKTGDWFEFEGGTCDAGEP